METMEAFPVELWLMICELLQNFSLIPLYKSGYYLSWILSDTIFATGLPRILPDLLKYLRMSDVVALRSTNGDFQILMDTLLENLENHSESRLFCRFVSAAKLPTGYSGRNPLLGRSFTINVKQGDSANNKVFQKFLREKGNRILKLKLVMEGNSAFEMRQQLHGYLGNVRNLRFLEIVIQVILTEGAELPPDYSTMAGIFGAGVPVALTLPLLKDLIITTQIFQNGAIKENTGGIEDFFAVLFCPQRSQVRRISLHFSGEMDYTHFANWFSWLTELQIHVRSGSQISNWKDLRIEKLTLFTDVQILFTGDVTPMQSLDIVDCISNVQCFKQTLTHFHVYFRNFVRQDVFSLECPDECFEMGRLRQLIVTNGILSPTFKGLQGLPALELIHNNIILEEPVSSDHDQVVIAAASKYLEISKYLPSLRLFVYESNGFRKSYVMDDFRGNPDTNLILASAWKRFQLVVVRSSFILSIIVLYVVLMLLLHRT